VLCRINLHCSINICELLVQGSNVEGNGATRLSPTHTSCGLSHRHRVATADERLIVLPNHQSEHICTFFDLRACIISRMPSGALTLICDGMYFSTRNLQSTSSHPLGAPHTGNSLRSKSLCEVRVVSTSRQAGRRPLPVMSDIDAAHKMDSGCLYI
jgi:hypothetical protein